MDVAFSVIQDTREREPWHLTGFACVKSQIVRRVIAGDYVILGNETLITIDRKKSVAELAQNLGARKRRFCRELERMQQYHFRYIVCEFTYEMLLKFPQGSGLPPYIKRKIRAKGPFLVKQIEKLTEEYGVKFIFCENREEAQEKAMELFQEALEYEKQQDSTELSENNRQCVAGD